jgi:hypothetical protein
MFFLSDEESQYFWDNYADIISLGDLPQGAIDRLETHAKTLYKILALFRTRAGEKLKAIDFINEGISIDSAVKMFALVSSRNPSAIQHYHNVDDSMESFIVYNQNLPV